MSIDWSEVLGELTTAILKIMVPVLITLILKWGADLYRKIKDGNPQLADLLKYAAQLGYAAAEEFFRDSETVTGNQKLEHAITEAEKYLRQFNVKVDLGVIKDAIIAYGVENYKFNWAADQKMDRYLYDETVLRDYEAQMNQQNTEMMHAEAEVMQENQEKKNEDEPEVKPESEEKDA